MTTTAPAPDQPSLYDRAGGMEGVRRLVTRFYALMDGEPDYAEVRAMHRETLDDMNESLTLFLAAWLGGPRDWFERKPGACMMSMHRGLGVTTQTAGQWLHAMGRAMAETSVEMGLARQMMGAFTRMASGMILQDDPAGEPERA